MEAFSQVRFPFPNDSSLCQAGIMVSTNSYQSKSNLNIPFNLAQYIENIISSTDGQHKCY